MSWVVDLGNTSLKCASSHEGVIDQSSAVVWQQEDITQTLDEVWGDLPAPAKIICSSVVSKKVNNEFSQWCNEVWGIEPQFIESPEKGCGVTNAYMDASFLGSDRWAGLVGAKHIIDKPCCIIDCGTATTIDVMQEDGQHLGGLILPGIALMRSSLLQGTSISIDGSEEGNSTLFARNTKDAIQGGGLYAMIATIDRVFQDVDVELGVEVSRVLTGGDAETLLPLLQGDIIYKPDLVLQGLAIIEKQLSDTKDVQ